MCLVYYNIIMKCFSMCSMKKLGLSNYFKIGLKWFRLYYRLNQSFPSFIDFLDSCNFCT